MTPVQPWSDHVLAQIDAARHRNNRPLRKKMRRLAPTWEQAMRRALSYASLYERRLKITGVPVGGQWYWSITPAPGGVAYTGGRRQWVRE